MSCARLDTLGESNCKGSCGFPSTRMRHVSDKVRVSAGSRLAGVLKVWSHVRYGRTSSSDSVRERGTLIHLEPWVMLYKTRECYITDPSESRWKTNIPSVISRCYITCYTTPVDVILQDVLQEGGVMYYTRALNSRHCEKGRPAALPTATDWGEELLDQAVLPLCVPHGPTLAARDRATPRRPRGYSESLRT